MDWAGFLGQILIEEVGLEVVSEHVILGIISGGRFAEEDFGYRREVIRIWGMRECLGSGRT